MPVADRNLAVGTKLTATYKKQPYVCTVEQGEGDKLAFVLEDGRSFTSPSAAASAVMGGAAANGWRWWNLASEVKAKAGKAAKAKRGGGGLFKVMKSQEGVPAGQIRYFCSACMGGFDAAEDTAPTVCPQGHEDKPTA